MKCYFVTGTDTEVGKSFIAAAILHKLAQQNLKTLGFKPIAAGCERTPQGLRNEDGLLLQKASSVAVEYELVNPIAFEPPVAPHLAAARVNLPIDTSVLSSTLAALQALEPDVLLVEGAGGWRLPLGQGRYLSQWCEQHDMPVILVVGIKLGCLNHAVLTVEAIERDGLPIAGWVANHHEENMPLRSENIDSLKMLIKAPFLGEVPKVNSYEQVGDYLDVSPITQY
jgi:dethiobiotin synthetase